MKAPLPIVQGVGPSCQWLPPGPWELLVDFLNDRYADVDAAIWEDRMIRGEVVDETGARLSKDSSYRIGACIFYYRSVESERKIPFDERVIYQDENILVVDKPHFLPVIPAGRFLHETLLVRLRKQGKPDALVPIHRLDRETAGIVLFSLNPKTRGYYTALFRERQVKKVYEALAADKPSLNFPHTVRSRIVRGEPFFRMKEVEGEPNSKTRIGVHKQHNDGTTIYRLYPVTGRKHQLRLHLSSLGIPIINDRLYPEVRSAAGTDTDHEFSNPLKLLARSVAFRDPLTGQEHLFKSQRML